MCLRHAICGVKFELNVTEFHTFTIFFESTDYDCCEIFVGRTNSTSYGLLYSDDNRSHFYQLGSGN